MTGQSRLLWERGWPPSLYSKMNHLFQRWAGQQYQDIKVGWANLLQNNSSKLGEFAKVTTDSSRTSNISKSVLYPASHHGLFPHCETHTQSSKRTLASGTYFPHLHKSRDNWGVMDVFKFIWPLKWPIKIIWIIQRIKQKNMNYLQIEKHASSQNTDCNSTFCKDDNEYSYVLHFLRQKRWRTMQTIVKACGLNYLFRFYNFYLPALASFISIMGQPDLIISF